MASIRTGGPDGALTALRHSQAARGKRRMLRPSTTPIPSLGSTRRPQEAVTMLFSRTKARMPEPSEILPGRSESMPVPGAHFVNGHPLTPPWPEG